MPSTIRKHGRAKGRAIPEFQPASDAQKAIFLKHYNQERNVAVACKAAGIRRNLYDHAMASDPEFRAKHAEIDEFYIDKLEVVAYDLAHGRRDPVMIKFLLERLRPEKYGNKSKVEISHRFNSPDELKQLTDDQFKDILAEYKIEDIETLF